MSATNFWNNFTNGFLNGMFNNNPFFGCFNGLGNFGGFGCNSFGLSMFNGWDTGFMGFGGSSPSLFLTPDFNMGSTYPLMPTMTPPSASFNFDMSNMFNNNIWENMQSINTFNNSFGNFDFTGTPSIAPINWDTFSNNIPITKPEKNEKITYDASALKKTWSKKKSGLSDAFYNKVVQVAKNVKCSPNDLMALMYSESGIDPAKSNNNGATGLIQFMPSTAKSLGTSTAALKNMSAVEQMNYVEKLIKNMKKSAGYSDSATLDAGTLYALIFLPAYANKEVLASKGDKYYASNKGLDTNKDGKITKADLANRLKNYYA